MTWYQVLLTFHILATMLWIGGAIAGTAIGMVLRKQGNTGAMGAFCVAFATVAGPLFGGSAMLVLITGIWMVALSGGYDFDAAFVSVGFVGWFVSLVLGATIVGRSWFKIGLQLREPDADITTMGAVFNRALLWTAVDLTIRIAVVFIMVWQPV